MGSIGVSQATLARFAQALGCPGFDEPRDALFEHLIRAMIHLGLSLPIEYLSDARESEEANIFRTAFGPVGEGLDRFRRAGVSSIELHHFSTRTEPRAVVRAAAASGPSDGLRERTVRALGLLSRQAADFDPSVRFVVELNPLRFGALGAPGPLSRSPTS